MKKLLTGNEAIARGVWEAGVRFASAYPGTPSTEILENIALYKDDILAEWATNEKVALEAVIGASFAGARSIAAMKAIGCTEEGILRNHMSTREGGRRGSIILSILKTEWFGGVKELIQKSIR